MLTGAVLGELVAGSYSQSWLSWLFFLGDSLDGDEELIKAYWAEEARRRAWRREHPDAVAGQEPDLLYEVMISVDDRTEWGDRDALEFLFKLNRAAPNRNGHLLVGLGPLGDWWLAANAGDRALATAHAQFDEDWAAALEECREYVSGYPEDYVPPAIALGRDRGSDQRCP